MVVAFVKYFHKTCLNLKYGFVHILSSQHTNNTRVCVVSQLFLKKKKPIRINDHMMVITIWFVTLSQSLASTDRKKKTLTLMVITIKLHCVLKLTIYESKIKLKTNCTCLISPPS